MKMEFDTLEDFLSKGTYLQNGDYVYKHDKQDYPLQKEIDANELYVITSADKHHLKALSFTGVVKEIDLEKADGFWWVLKLPETVRKQIGLQ